MMKKRLSKTLWYGTDVDSYGNPIIPSFTADQHDLDGLHIGELFLHYSDGIATLWTANESGNIVKISSGGGGVDLSQYLLKSEFNKIWEIRTDSQGTEYIFGKLPVVTQYGITMYSGENMNIPTIAEGLPFDNRTIWFNPTTNQIEVIGGTGGGSGEGVSNFWDLSGIPSWITNTKPTYSYSEIEGTPDLSKYALVSDIPSLSGYATEQWVIGKGYALSSDLAKYIPIAGATDITGEKNFTGGLKVNGSPIYYDTEKKYWKLEGDLLVTGGVTMYGNDSEFVASTIMDAIVYDDTTLGINAQGQLYVKGSVGGATTLGGLSNVGSWADSVASQDRIMYQAANSSQWVAKNLSDLAVGGVTGNYLPLSGGTLSDGLTINQTTRSALVLNEPNGGKTEIVFQKSGSTKGGIRLNDSNYLESLNMNKYQWELLLTSDNYSSYVLPLSGGTMTGTINTQFIRPSVNAAYQCGTSSLRWDNVYSVYGNFSDSVTINGNTAWHSGNDGSGSGLDADMLDGMHLNRDHKPYGKIPSIGADGVMEVGKYIDFHNDNTTGSDFSTRLICSGEHGNNVSLPSASGTLALTSSNVASATKLQTARTIWGQSFNGTGNVDGLLSISEGSNSNSRATINLLTISNNPCDFYLGSNNIKKWSITARHTDQNYALGIYNASNGAYAMWIDNATNNIGIGTTTPAYNLDIVGNSRSSVMFFWNKNWNGNAGYIGRGSTSVDRIILYAGNDDVYIYSKGVISTIFTGANMTVQGGITMYSDIRKKTKLKDVVLSLQQVANAPLIEHYYNSDQNKTTHVGSVAQYWAEMNDWFCKKDSEGFYTMEIQNAALASAISVARELVKFETETDRRIRLLEDENKRLKEEVEQLKWNIA